MLAGFLLFLCCRSVSLPISLCLLSFNNCIRSRLVFIYLCWVSPACLFCTCGLQESFQFLRSWRDFSLSLVLQKLFKRLCLGLKDRRIFRCIIQIFLPFLSWSSVQINYGGKKRNLRVICLSAMIFSPDSVLVNGGWCRYTSVDSSNRVAVVSSCWHVVLDRVKSLKNPFPCDINLVGFCWASLCLFSNTGMGF